MDAYSLLLATLTSTVLADRNMLYTCFYLTFLIEVVQTGVQLCVKESPTLSAAISAAAAAVLTQSPGTHLLRASGVSL